MRQVDREYCIMRETREDDALKMIHVERKHLIPDNEIREDIAEEFGYSEGFIEELFKIIDAKDSIVSSDSHSN